MGRRSTVVSPALSVQVGEVLAVYGAPERVVPMTPHVERWARQFTGEARRPLSVQEDVIVEGDVLYVLGWAQESAGVPTLRDHSLSARPRDSPRR